MNNFETLFDDLMALCESTEAFYYVDHVRFGDTYRVFSYRLASYSDFQKKAATECRGHTFVNKGNRWELVSLPMQKFFNWGEHVGWGTDLNSPVAAVMDKLDGSLISTVACSGGATYEYATEFSSYDVSVDFFLKSKTSFTSAQAIAAFEWLKSQLDFIVAVDEAVRDGYTVNFEWVSPDNQIVIGYPESRLIVLNSRNIKTGEYMSCKSLISRFGVKNVVQSFSVPENLDEFIVAAEKMTGIEGFIICLENGLWIKHKTEAYCTLHHLKDSINNQKALWEACVNETADDLRAMFSDDAVSVAKIISMEEKASTVYSSIHRALMAFYETSKELDRKSYAIKGQAELNKSGIFPLAMNMFLGKEVDIKGFMIKNYKDFIKEESQISETENE